MALSQKTIRSVVLHALSYHAKKEADRDALSPGSVPLSVTVFGTVHRTPVDFSLTGVLLVGDDQSAASSSAPPAAEVLACLMGKCPTLAGAMKRMAESFKKTGSLTTMRGDDLTLAEGFFRDLRNVQTVTKRGNVRFEVAAPQDLAADPDEDPAGALESTGSKTQRTLPFTKPKRSARPARRAA